MSNPTEPKDQEENTAGQDVGSDGSARKPGDEPLGYDKTPTNAAGLESGREADPETITGEELPAEKENNIKKILVPKARAVAGINRKILKTVLLGFGAITMVVYLYGVVSRNATVGVAGRNQENRTEDAPNTIMPRKLHVSDSDLRLAVEEEEAPVEEPEKEDVFVRDAQGNIVLDRRGQPIIRDEVLPSELTSTDRAPDHRAVPTTESNREAAPTVTYVRQADRPRDPPPDPLAEAKRSGLFAVVQGDGAGLFAGGGMGAVGAQPGGTMTVEGVPGFGRGAQGGRDGQEAYLAAMAALNANETAYQQQNMQDEMAAYLQRRQHANEGVLKSLPQPAHSPWTVYAGTVIPIVLVTGINSDLPGKIVGRVLSDVWDTVNGYYLIVPAGSTVLGDYASAVAWGQERLLVAWERMIRPDGSSIDLRGMQGVDLAGFSGYSDQVDTHWREILTALGVGTVLNIGAGGIAEWAEAVGNRIAGTIADGGSKARDVFAAMGERWLDRQPTLVIRQGKRANILINKDMIIPPYQDIVKGGTR